MFSIFVATALLAAQPSQKLKPEWSRETVVAQRPILEFQPDGELLWTNGPTKDGLQTLIAVDPATGKPTDRELVFPGRVLGVRFYDDQAVSIAGKRVIGWDMTTLRPRWTHELAVRPVSLSLADGGQAIAIACGEREYNLDDPDKNSERGSLVIFGSRNPEELKTEIEFERAPIRVAISSDAGRIAVRFPNATPGMRIFDGKGEEIAEVGELATRDVSEFQFIHGTRELMVGQHRGDAHLLRTTDAGKVVVSCHQNPSKRTTTALHACRNRSLVATASLEDGFFNTYFEAIRVFDAASLTELASYSASPLAKSYYSVVRFSPDGSCLATLSKEGELKLFNLQGLDASDEPAR